MSGKLRVLDLFSGIGGFSLGLERTGGFETVAFCEIDPFCRRVLAKHWPNVRQFEDVTKLRGEDVGPVDVICGGYPCQGESYAGKRKGAEDDRWLWPEMHRLVDELRPSWVVGENVAGHVTLGLDTVLSDLDLSGYAARSFVVPAVALDARHIRARVWTIAHPRSQQHESSGAEVQWPAAEIVSLADALSQRGRGRNPGRQDAADVGQSPGHSQHWQWSPEPNVGRVANGVPSRVDRLRALGNAVVPQIPELIGRAIVEQRAA